MCFKCRIQRDIERSVKDYNHLANMKASAVYRNLVEGKKSLRCLKKEEENGIK
jgi:hypothetical protein